MSFQDPKLSLSTELQNASAIAVLPSKRTVKPVLSRPHIKQTPSIKQAPAQVPKFYSHIYCKINPSLQITVGHQTIVW